MAARGMLNFTGIAVMRDRCSTSAHRIWFTYLFRRLGSMYGKHWTTHEIVLVITFRQKNFAEVRSASLKF